MPTNLYGPGDNFDLNSSHVLPALMRKFHDADRPGRPRSRGLGHRFADARVPARRRPRRCLPVPDGALLPTTRTSTSAPASTCRSATSPRRSATSSTPRRRWCSTAPSPTARLARCSTCRSSAISVGRRARPRRGIRRPTSGSSTRVSPKATAHGKHHIAQVQSGELSAPFANHAGGGQTFLDPPHRVLPGSRGTGQGSFSRQVGNLCSATVSSCVASPRDRRPVPVRVRHLLP